MAVSTPVPVRRGRRRRIKWGAYLFLLPAFVLFAVFVAYPIGFNTYLSLHNWNGVSDVWEWVGFEHFGRLPEERTIRLSLRNSGFFFAGHLVNMAVALLLAVLLNNPIPGRNLARTLIFVPFVVAGSIVAVTWQTIYAPNIGALNNNLRRLGLEVLAQNWLADPRLAIWSLVVVEFGYGAAVSLFTMVILVLLILLQRLMLREQRID